jgi:hypothetical protein
MEGQSKILEEEKEIEGKIERPHFTFFHNPSLHILTAS